MKITQYELNAEQQDSLRWGSHIPVNKSILRSFPVTGVLELGAGWNSTPMFFEQIEYVVSVEADAGWIETLRTAVVEDDNHRFVHHSVPDNITRYNHRDQIPAAVLDDANELYQSVRNEHLNYLFVDCYTGFRLSAMNELYNDFDIIVYHDAEDPQYGYCEFKPNLSYHHWIDKTFLVHTGIVISNRLSAYIEGFKRALKEEATLHADSFGITDALMLRQIQ